MEKEKVCPILTVNTVIERNTVTIRTQPVICLEDGCALWDAERHKCAIAVTPPRR